MNQSVAVKAQRPAAVRSIGCFGLCFAFFAFLMWCVPHASDDFEFAALSFSSGEELFSYILHYGNGRFLGNLGAITMSQSPALRILVKAFLLSGMVFALPRLLELPRSWGDYLSFFLIVGIHPALFGEVYTWTSGFANYIPPVWATLMVLLLLKQYPRLRSGAVRVLVCLCVAVLGLAAQLYVEHSSLIQLFLALSVTVLTFRPRFRSAAAPARVWLVAAALGLALMFLIPKLFFVADNRSVGYRSFNTGSLMALVYSCAKNALHLGNYFTGTTALPLCLGALATLRMTRHRRGEKANAILGGLGILCCVYFVMTAMLSMDAWNGEPAMVHHIVTFVLVLLSLLLWFLAAAKLEEPAVRLTVLFLLCCAVLSLLPLLVVSPTPMRTVFQPYVFLAAAFLLCVKELELPAPVQTGLRSWLPAICICVALLMGTVFWGIRQMAQDRERHILTLMEQGTDFVEIYQIPYGYVFWDDRWCFCEYYYFEEPGDVGFWDIPYIYWRDKYL